MTILELQGLHKNFGGFCATYDVSLKVEAGALCSVIGPNGAGKTTLFNLVSGRCRPDQGAVLLRGENITGLAPHTLVRRGIGRSFQITNIFGDLTVLANICIAITARICRSYDCFRSFRLSRAVNEEAWSIIESIGLRAYGNYKANALSHGDRKVLEFGLVLALKPTVMLLDEPTAGMNQEETDSTVSLIKQMSAHNNITVLMTEHDIDMVFRISDYIAVLHQGRMIAEGRPEEVRANETVRAVYLGEN